MTRAGNKSEARRGDTRPSSPPMDPWPRVRDRRAGIAFVRPGAKERGSGSPRPAERPAELDHRSPFLITWTLGLGFHPSARGPARPCPRSPWLGRYDVRGGGRRQHRRAGGFPASSFEWPRRSGGRDPARRSPRRPQHVPIRGRARADRTPRPRSDPGRCHRGRRHRRGCGRHGSISRDPANSRRVIFDPRPPFPESSASPGPRPSWAPPRSPDWRSPRASAPPRAPSPIQGDDWAIRFSSVTHFGAPPRSRSAGNASR